MNTELTFATDFDTFDHICSVVVSHMKSIDVNSDTIAILPGIIERGDIQPENIHRYGGGFICRVKEKSVLYVATKSLLMWIMIVDLGNHNGPLIITHIQFTGNHTTHTVFKNIEQIIDNFNVCNKKRLLKRTNKRLAISLLLDNEIAIQSLTDKLYKIRHNHQCGMQQVTEQLL